MKLLAVDTATQACSIALAENDRIIFESTADYARTHTRHLLTMIDDALRQAETDIDEIDGFAVTVGPGSFTGLRIGISMVKGLARAASKPVMGVSSLEALAYQFAGTRDLVCPVVDARKKEVYTALYKWSGDRFETIRPPQVGRPDEVLEQIGGRCIFVGNGAVLYRDLIEKQLGTSGVTVPPAMNMIRASLVAHLGFRRFSESGPLSPSEIQPLYIRRSDAEHAKIALQAC